MSDYALKPHTNEKGALAAERRRCLNGARRRSVFLTRWLPSVWFAIAVLLGTGLSAPAQSNTQSNPNPCPVGQPFVKVPELTSQGGKLRGTVMLSDQQVLIPFRVPVSKETPTSTWQCLPQYVRVFSGVGAVPAVAPPASGSYANPLPGPTLRARVGDLIQLTFINQINPAHFGNSIDRGETGVGGGCDESNAGYPGSDAYPDCFHGSSTGNLHYHGTHTNPNTTGDNVLLEIRPSLRVNNQPIVTQDSVKNSFNEFFDRCEAELSVSPLSQWPKKWSDLPRSYTAEQEWLLKLYDDQMRKNYGSKARLLWPVNEKQLAEGAWPQYYIGAFPYCFRLPQYTASVFPPPVDHSMKHGGAGTAEQSDLMRPLMMGQSPGTHWYHAHKHGSTAINVANGMTGAFIIEGKYDDDLNTWYGENWTRTQPVMVINQLGVSPNLMRGAGGRFDKGPSFTINGRLQPIIQMRPNEVQMWRILNTSGRAGALFDSLKDPNNTFAGFHWRQLAQDGVQFNDTNYKASEDMSFLLASGNRADLLVKAPSKKGTYTLQVRNEVDPGDLVGDNKVFRVTFLTVNVSDQAIDPASHRAQFIPNAPSFPVYLADITSAEVKGTKKLVFSTDNNNQNGPPNPASQTIDGKGFDGEVGEVVLLNTVEEWTIMNTTFNISHPFHIHINPFQVVEVFSPNDPLIDPATGKPTTAIDKHTQKPALKYTFFKDKDTLDGQCYLDPDNPESWKPCDPQPKSNFVWWDVFPIPSAYAPTTDAAGKVPLLNKAGKAVVVPGYFKMRSRFVDYSGYYVIHCHILAHEDRGMMTIVEVAPSRTPYSHH